MQKWDYKTIQATNHRDFDEQSVVLGQDGWESLGTQNINGWVVGKFKRPTQGFDSTDSLSNLISVVSDPKKYQKLLSDLKDAYVDHVKNMDELLAAQAASTSRQASAEIAIKDANVAQIEAKKVSELVQRDKEVLEASKKAHQEILKAHKASVDSHRQVMSTDLAKLEELKKMLEASLTSRESVVSQKEKDISKREANVSRREETVSVKERQVAGVLQEFQGLTKKVSG